MKVRAWVAVLLLPLLGGCGFHLRGSDLSANIDTAYVRTGARVSVGDKLERTLGFAGVDVVDDRTTADVIIDLTAQEERRRSVSVTERSRAAEYELSLILRYRIDRGGSGDAADTGEQGTDADVLVAERSVRAARTFRIDRNNIIGSSEEQALLRGEMEQDLVQQIVRSLETATRASASSETAESADSEGSAGSS